jgi:hypothetical protein
MRKQAVPAAKRLGLYRRKGDEYQADIHTVLAVYIRQE